MKRSSKRAVAVAFVLTQNRTSAATFFALLTKRWIFAVGVFVVLGITAVVMLPSFKSENRGLMAQQEGKELAVRESLA